MTPTGLQDLSYIKQAYGIPEQDSTAAGGGVPCTWESVRQRWLEGPQAKCRGGQLSHRATMWRGQCLVSGMVMGLVMLAFCVIISRHSSLGTADSGGEHCDMMWIENSLAVSGEGGGEPQNTTNS